MMTKFLMETESFSDEIFYRVGCVCGEEKHDITLDFHVDNFSSSSKEVSYKQITLSAYMPLISCSFKSSFFGRLVWKLKRIKEIIFNGYVTSDINFVFDNRNLQALKVAISEAEQRLS